MYTGRLPTARHYLGRDRQILIKISHNLLSPVVYLSKHEPTSFLATCMKFAVYDCSLRLTCCHFGEIFFPDCTESCWNDHCRCYWWFYYKSAFSFQCLASNYMYIYSYMCACVFAIWHLSFSMDNAFKSQGSSPGRSGQMFFITIPTWYINTLSEKL